MSKSVALPAHSTAHMAECLLSIGAELRKLQGLDELARRRIDNMQMTIRMALHPYDIPPTVAICEHCGTPFTGEEVG